MIRKPVIIIAVVGQFVALLLLANIFLDTPLSSPPGPGGASYVRARALSEPAIAGMENFGDHCSACHGSSAEGTDQAPALLDRSYAVDFRDSRLFHEEVAQDIPAHRDILDAGQDGSALSFNSVELMSKFLREMRRNQQNKEDG